MAMSSTSSAGGGAGAREIESKLTAAFAFVFKDSTLSITDVKVRSLGPTVAVAYVRWTMTGAPDPAGDAGAAPGNPASGADEREQRVADRKLPEHQQHSGIPVSNEPARQAGEALTQTLVQNRRR
jgi:hypothetical protein